MAVPACRTTVDALPMAYLGTLVFSDAASVLATEAILGLLGAAVNDTSMWFSLSEKAADAPLAVRAHPSGTFTEYPPGAGLNATYKALSGMSPDGFTSVAFGASTPGAGWLVATAVGEDVDVPPGLVTGDEPASVPGDPEHAARMAVVATAPAMVKVLRAVMMPPAREQRGTNNDTGDVRKPAVNGRTGNGKRKAKAFG